MIAPYLFCNIFLELEYCGISQGKDFILFSYTNVFFINNQTIRFKFSDTNLTLYITFLNFETHLPFLSEVSSTWNITYIKTTVSLLTMFSTVFFTNHVNERCNAEKKHCPENLFMCENIAHLLHSENEILWNQDWSIETCREVSQNVLITLGQLAVAIWLYGKQSVSSHCFHFLWLWAVKFGFRKLLTRKEMFITWCIWIEKSLKANSNFKGFCERNSLIPEIVFYKMNSTFSKRFSITLHWSGFFHISNYQGDV